MIRFNPKHQIIVLIAITTLFLGCNNLIKNDGIASKYTGILAIHPPKMLTVGKTNMSNRIFSMNSAFNMPGDSLITFPALSFNYDLGRDYHEKVTQMVKAFYHANNNESKWLGASAPFPLYFDLLSFNSQLWKDGLDQNDYLLHYFQGDIITAYNEKDDEQLKKLDYHLTYAFFMISHHIAYGKINPEKFNGYWHLDAIDQDAFNAYQLSNIQSNRDFFDFIRQIRPAHSQYDRLRNKLIELTVKMNEGLTNTMQLKPIDEPVKPGDSSTFVSLLRERFAGINQELANTDQPAVYDEQLAEVVKTYQRNNGLVADGEVGNITITHLNKGADQHIETIKINMERLRWLPANYGENHILVNIPNYSLELFQGGKKSYEMRVVVGTNRTKTPVFSDTLQYVVFSPTWTVPRSIKVNEILHKLKNNKDYYSNRDFKFYNTASNTEINPSSVDWASVNRSNFNYDVVQQPGQANSLGKVKFIMPNDMNIYLHDTPSQKLFNKNKRNFSHGCVRVAEPTKLAQLLLQDHQNIDTTNIEKYMSLSRPKHVNLTQNYHVQIEYRTAWVDDKGELQLREDVYGHDKVQVSQYLQNAMAFVE